MGIRHQRPPGIVIHIQVATDQGIVNPPFPQFCADSQRPETLAHAFIDVGIRIVFIALQAPLRQIVQNLLNPLGVEAPLIELADQFRAAVLAGSEQT